MTGLKKSNNHMKAVFLDRDGVLNWDTDLIHRVEDFHLYSYTPEAIKKLEQAGFLRLVVTNQSAIARGLLTEDYLTKVIHKKMHDALEAAGTSVNGIYYCPHHPTGNFPNAQPNYICDCDCRKPNTGLLKQALSAFPKINLSQSWLIGDSKRDIEAGQKMGLKTIGVLTGHGKKNFPEHIQPDYIATNLLEAVGIILMSS
jgi:D,D-heptose 1,7-bisphosphate phosphatase